MLSPADMLIIGAAALIVFGPDQLPKVARRAGQVIRDVQNTSQSFVREMERAADEAEHRWEPEPAYVEPPPAPVAEQRGPERPSEHTPEHTMGERSTPAFAHEDLLGPPEPGASTRG